MASVKTLPKKYPAMEDGGTFGMSTKKQEEFFSDGALIGNSKRRHYTGNKSWDSHQVQRGDGWNGTKYGMKSHSSSNSRPVHGNEDGSGMPNIAGKSFGDTQYQNGNWENGDYSEEQGWKLYTFGAGMGMRMHHDGPPVGSRMGPGQDYRTGNVGLNYFDAYAGVRPNVRPVGTGMGTGPLLGSGMGSGRAYDQLHSGQYNSHQYQSTMMGGAKEGPHPKPYPMQGHHQYSMMMPPPMYPRGFPGQYPPGLLNHKDEKDHSKMVAGGRGYMGRTHPSHTQAGLEDFHMAKRHHQIGEGGRGKDSDGVVAKYSVPSHSHSADESGMETNSKEKLMILLRGLPGSGKTTLAKTLVGTHGVICSTDDFFEENGRQVIVDIWYVFDPSKLSTNHQKNKEKARVAMEKGKSPVIIDNTNTTAWEMKPYIVMAVKDYGYSVQIQEPTTPWRFKTSELARRNIHGVTRQTLDRILEKFQHRVSVESILGDSASLPSRSVSSPTKPSNMDAQEPSRTSRENSTSRSSKPVGSQNSKEDMIAGHVFSVSDVERQKGEDKMRSVSPGVRSPRSAGHVSPSIGHRGRGRGRGDSMTAVGRGRGGAKLGRKIGGENVDSSLHEVKEEFESRRELYWPENKRNGNQTAKDTRDRSRNGSDDEFDSTYWDIPSHILGSKQEENIEELTPGFSRNGSVGTFGLASKIGVPLKKLLSGTAREQYRNWNLSGASVETVEPKNVETLEPRTIGIWEPSSEGIRRKRSTGKMSEDEVSVVSRDKSGRNSSDNSKKLSGIWSNTNQGAARQTWSLTAESSKNGGAKQADKTDGGDVWDSADEMDLSTEDEGSRSTDDTSIAEDKNQDALSRDEQTESSDKIPEEATVKVEKVASLMTNLPLKKLEEALESCLFNKYIVEGQMDERKYSLKDQKRLVTQLVKEHQSLCGESAADSQPCTAHTRDGCLSLEVVLDRVRMDSLHTQLPNALVELMFRDRQLVPRWKIDGVEERSAEPVAVPVIPPTIAPSRKESKFLKLVPKMEEADTSSISLSATGTGKGVSDINIGNEEEVDEDVDDPAIMRIVRPKRQAVTKDTVESLWEALPSSTLETNVETRSSVKASGSSAETPPLAWLTGASQWANPELLSESLSRPKKTMMNEEGISEVVSSLKVPVSSSAHLPSAEGVSSVVHHARAVTEISSSLSSLQPVALTDAKSDRRLSPTDLAYNGTTENRAKYDVLEQLKPLDNSGEREERKSSQSLSDNLASATSERYVFSYRNGDGLSVAEDSVVFPSAIEDQISRDQSSSESSPTSDYADAGACAVMKAGDDSQELRGAEGNSDLNFLVGCFPDLSRHQLQKLLEVNGGDVELTTISALSAQPDTYDTIGHASLGTLDVDARASSHISLDEFPVISSHASKNGQTYKEKIQTSANSFGLESVPLKGRGSYKEQVSDGDHAMDDEMPSLLAWTDSDVDGAPGLVPGNQADINDALTWDVPEEDGTEVEEIGNEELQYETGFLQEDNLVLKLSESLAIQLQSQFGSVDQTLLQEDCTGSDLTVLLSETAAMQIYHKWVDTLKARAVENKVMAQLKERGSPAVAAKYPVKKSAVQARNGPITSGVVRNSGSGLSVSSRPVNAGVAHGSKTNSSKTSAKQKHGQSLELDASENTSYDAMRSNAMFHADKRSECFQKAAEARSRKRYEVASYYAQQGHHHTQKLKEANRKAALLTLEKNNTLRPGNQIDLHGLHVNEAVAALSEKLNQLDEGEELGVITGYGSGSVKKEARIKPVVKKYLTRNNIWFEEKNPGLLKVIMKWRM